MLAQSGLAHEWRREATECYTYLRNIHDVVHDGKTPCELRRGVIFDGYPLPFWCAVDYKPHAKRGTADHQKFDISTRLGIFMGYHPKSGGKWSGDYLVIDASAYSSYPDRRYLKVHRVKEWAPHKPIVSPVANGTAPRLTRSMILHVQEASAIPLENM